MGAGGGPEQARARHRRRARPRARRPGRRARPIGLDDALDRDLGIGSLERVELLLRIEKALGVRLSDAGHGGGREPRAISSPPSIAPGPPRPEAPAARAPRAGAGRGRPGVARRRSSRCSTGTRRPTRSACTSCSPAEAGAVDHLWRALAARAAGGGGAARARRGARRSRRADAPDGGGVLRRLLRRPARGRGAGPDLSPVPARSDRGVRAAPGRHPRQRRGAGAHHVSGGRAGGGAPALPRALAAPSWPRPASLAGTAPGDAPAPRGRGRRPDPVHVGQHGRAQGRAALARQPPRQHPRHRSRRSPSAPTTSP